MFENLRANNVFGEGGKGGGVIMMLKTAADHK
jgi:hypothetical protein